MSNEGMFRGYRQISEIAAKVVKLATDLNMMKNERSTIHLTPRDYYLVSRWQKAGALCQFSYDTTPEGVKIRFNTHPIEKAAGVYVVPKKKGRK